MSNDFLKALQQSQELPELPEQVAGKIPDLLGGETGQENLIRKIGNNERDKIPGGTELGFEFKCARLVIGKVSTGYSQGQETFEDCDDGEQLKAIMDKSLRGESIINKKEHTFLKDGSVAIWVEWMEPINAPPRKDRSYLTEGELTDPELSTRAPREKSPVGDDDDSSESETADALDGDGSSEAGTDDAYPFRTGEDQVPADADDDEADS